MTIGRGCYVKHGYGRKFYKNVPIYRRVVIEYIVIHELDLHIKTKYSYIYYDDDDVCCWSKIIGKFLMTWFIVVNKKFFFSIIYRRLLHTRKIGGICFCIRVDIRKRIRYIVRFMRGNYIRRISLYINSNVSRRSCSLVSWVLKVKPHLCLEWVKCYENINFASN